jgi:hypothetical protein
VTRARGWDLTCLGYGGQRHLDPLIACTIRDRYADLISMCVGINIYGQGSLNVRTFLPAVPRNGGIGKRKPAWCAADQSGNCEQTGASLLPPL